MFGGLQRLGHDLEIVSAMVEDVPNGGLPLRRVAPIPVYLRPDLRFNPTHWYIAGTNNYVSKTVSFPRIVRAVRRYRKRFRPDVIHFIENYGPAMAPLRLAFPHVPLTISAPTYQPNRPLYDLFLEASFASFDTVVPFSDAYQRRLLELRFRRERVRRIRWGIDVDRFAVPSDEQRAAARKELGLGRSRSWGSGPGSFSRRRRTICARRCRPRSGPFEATRRSMPFSSASSRSTSRSRSGRSNAPDCASSGRPRPFKRRAHPPTSSSLLSKTPDRPPLRPSHGSSPSRWASRS